MELNNKIVCIIGAAKSGLATARFVLDRGASIKISEAKPMAAVEDVLDHLVTDPRVTVETGGHTEAFIATSDLVVVSPGVPRESDPIQWALAEGLEVMSEVELASRFCQTPVIAVTGSNGKTTTATLIGRVLEAVGKRVMVCGNIGTPWISCVDEPDLDYMVVEVSSFQLEWVHTLKPLIGVFLNFSQNHLDRHASLEEYFDAKARLFRQQTDEDYAILNNEDERMIALSAELNAKSIFYNDRNRRNRYRNPNGLAVLAVAEVLGLDKAVCCDVLDDFKGVEHRLEHVADVDGVSFINDSKSTTVASGRWALAHINQPIVMICGGRDKNADFTEISELVRDRVKHMIVIGEASEKIKNAFDRVVPVVTISTLEAAIDLAQMKSNKGDVVLFSPMCASFDMFDNYEHRGKVFKQLVTRR